MKKKKQIMHYQFGSQFTTEPHDAIMKKKKQIMYYQFGSHQHNNQVSDSVIHFRLVTLLHIRKSRIAMY